MYESVLLPIDWEDPFDASLRHAVAVAGCFDATLSVLSVATDAFGEQTRDQLRTDPVEKAHEAVKTVQAEAERDGLDTIGDVQKGEPHETIVQYAASTGTDLIVMGSSERSNIERLLTRSVAEHVVRETPVPVMVVKLDP